MDALLWVGLGNALAATALAVLAALTGRLSKRPALVHGLWVLVLLKCVTPPLFPVALPGATPVPSPPPAVTEEPAATDVVLLGPLPDLPQLVEPVPAVEPAMPSSGPSLTTLVLCAWAAGAVLWWGVAAVRLVRFRRLLRLLPAAPDGMQEQIDDLARRLGLARGPVVCVVPAAVSPLVWGLGRGRLVLPAGLWERLDPGQQETILAHELAHLRRGDQWVRLLELVVLGLYWWLPVVWWARRALQEAEEQCCDAWVVWLFPESAPAYASALVESAAWLSRARAPLPATASGVGPMRQLQRRVLMVLRGSTPRSLGGGSLAVLVLLGLVLLPLAPGLTKPPPTPDPARAVDRVAPPAAGATDDPNVTPRLPGPKATPAPAPKPAPALSREALQKAEDEVELLEAQHRVKEAQLVASKVALDHGTVRLQRIEKLSATGAVGEREVLTAQQEVDGLKGQVMIREAELRESTVRLSQARRNLKRLSDVPEPGRKADDATRLKELEDKLDRLLKEVENLRRQLKEKPGGKLDPGATDVPILPTRGARIPFQILEGAKDRVARVQLLSSTDGGKTWQHAARANPDEKSFDFRAPAPGLYSLGVRLEFKDGRHEPPDEAQVRPGLRVLVVDKPE